VFDRLLAEITCRADVLGDLDWLVHYPDGSAQYTAIRFTQRLHDAGIQPSMGGVGTCFDNAMIESFWSRMQVELLDRRRWRTRLELANAIFEYLELFHNRQRRHSALGMLSPIEFETRQPTPRGMKNPVLRLHKPRGTPGVRAAVTIAVSREVEADTEPCG
jgi:putative transposase